jgi:hypothetical protein
MYLYRKIRISNTGIEPCEDWHPVAVGTPAQLKRYLRSAGWECSYSRWWSKRYSTIIASVMDGVKRGRPFYIELKEGRE